MIRYILVLVLIAIVARAVWRIVDGVIEGVRGAPRTPTAGVPMERDPVCGTFVVPHRAVALTDGNRRLYFCSAACRDKYRARIA